MCKEEEEKEVALFVRIRVCDVDANLAALKSSEVHSIVSDPKSIVK